MYMRGPRHSATASSSIRTRTLFALIAPIPVLIRIALSCVAPIPDPSGRLITETGTVVCRNPFDLRKAIVAAHQGDGMRLLQLDCKRPGANSPVRALAGSMPLNGPWHIELTDDEGIASKAWAYGQEFRNIRARP